MTPPEAPVAGPRAGPAETPPAVSVCLEGLKTRADFLAAARARKQVAAGFILQARERGGDSAAIRAGFTASKKVGNAVLRNRAKRRLRAVAREVLPVHGLPGWDYVLIARAGVSVTRAFTDLRGDLIRALEKIHPHTG